jgi:hypothetical protein
MSKYDDQYYIVDEVYDENTLYLKALKKSANRKYSYKKMELGEEPLFFENAYKDEDINEGVIREIKSAHMNMSMVIVNDKIRSLLKGFNIDGFQLYPSVLIDDKDKYHEGYWHFNIFSKKAYVDFEKCEIRDYEEDNTRHQVKKYSLSDKELNRVPEERRLIFKPVNTDLGYTFVHQKIVDIFNGCGVDNIKFYKVSEWEKGMQFQEE